LVTKNSYINCSDKELKCKDQNFDKAAKKIVNGSNTVSQTRSLDISFGSMFQVKYKIIMIIIIIVAAIAITITVLITFLYYY
jgi:hypothetical protein